MLKNNRKFS